MNVFAQNARPTLASARAGSITAASSSLNGRMYRGAYPFDGFEAIIDAAAARGSHLVVLFRSVKTYSRPVFRHSWFVSRVPT
ncbi:MAG: hypothetical protein ABI625_20865, partial [bacterium]